MPPDLNLKYIIATIAFSIIVEFIPCRDVVLGNSCEAEVLAAEKASSAYDIDGIDPIEKSSAVLIYLGKYWQEIGISLPKHVWFKKGQGQGCLPGVPLECPPMRAARARRRSWELFLFEKH